MHFLKRRPSKLWLTALRNRQEIIKAGLGRRELFKMGLLTGGGYLVAKSGLSAWASDGGSDECRLGNSPPTTPFIDPLRIPPILPERALSEFTPAPQECPNNAINPATGLPFEGRGQYNGVLRPGTDCFQFFRRFPPESFFISRMRENTRFRITSDPNIPDQTIWGHNLGGDDPAMTPGPTIVDTYDGARVVRRFNELPPQAQNGGFGVPETSTHFHNFHDAPETDGSPCRFFFRGQYYDYYRTMQTAGFDDPNTDPRERLLEFQSTLWYHDHRVEHTAENVYKGLLGFELLFNQFDTGNENTGFHLPTFPDFDVPLALTDKLLDPRTGKICFDLFGFDGLVGDKLLVNGVIQPFFEVQKRRYRFRILDGGPSRFYELFLTNPDNPRQTIPFWLIANDGNLVPRPVPLPLSADRSVRLGVAERADIIVDFQKIARDLGAKRLWLENRLEQVNGRGPTGKILPAGQRQNVLVEFRIVGNAVTDHSVDPADPAVRFYDLPTRPVPRITRQFRFERGNGQWQINGRFMDCDRIRFTVNRNSAERWILQNNSGGWQHPIHIHLEEFQIVKHNGRVIQPGDVEFSRKDVVQVGFNDQVELVMRFRDFRGDYPMHCHNTIHEDHAMMLLWAVQDDANDNNTNP
ncbi:MAG: hypothetical protein E6J71_25120 [Deltaproteobacteria bacterium]|nr:MAG: hypothetical protein E6J71_25120 [Deltaproteobacteria bacterium]